MVRDHPQADKRVLRRAAQVDGGVPAAWIALDFALKIP